MEMTRNTFRKLNWSNLSILFALLILLTANAKADQLDDLFYAEEIEPVYEIAYPLAHEGDSRAQMYLGAIYWDTRFEGQNPDLALMWLQIAYANGEEGAAEFLDQVLPYYVDSQIDRVLVKAAQCIESNYRACE